MKLGSQEFRIETTLSQDETRRAIAAGTRRPTFRAEGDCGSKRYVPLRGIAVTSSAEVQLVHQAGWNEALPVLKIRYDDGWSLRASAAIPSFAWIQIGLVSATCLTITGMLLWAHYQGNGSFLVRSPIYAIWILGGAEAAYLAWLRWRARQAWRTVVGMVRAAEALKSEDSE